jgi:hypothetical protein
MGARQVYDCDYCGKTSDNRKDKGWISLDGVVWMGQGYDQKLVHVGNRRAEIVDYCSVLCFQGAVAKRAAEQNATL